MTRPFPLAPSPIASAKPASQSPMSAQTDAHLKEQVEQISDRLGLNTTSAINIFDKHVLSLKN